MRRDPIKELKAALATAGGAYVQVVAWDVAQVSAAAQLDSEVAILWKATHNLPPQSVVSILTDRLRHLLELADAARREPPAPGPDVPEREEESV